MRTFSSFLYKTIHFSANIKCIIEMFLNITHKNTDEINSLDIIIIQGYAFLYSKSIEKQIIAMFYKCLPMFQPLLDIFIVQSP